MRGGELFSSGKRLIMTKLVHALAALGVALLLGCGADFADSPQQRDGAEGYTNGDGEWRPCDPISEAEAPYVGAPGWKEACNGVERMGDVAVGLPLDEGNEALFGAPIPGADIATENGELGQLKQPITVLMGVGHSVTLNSNGKITGFNGGCKFNPNWNTSKPLTDTCIIPEKASFNWRQCPAGNDFPSCNIGGANSQYLQERWGNAWNMWRYSTTCNGVTKTPGIQQSSFAMKNDLSTPADNYNTANIPWYYADTNNARRILGSVNFWDSVLTAKTPVVQGVRYYTFRHASVTINIEGLELIKAPICNFSSATVGTTKFVNGLARAYERAMAHELGHVWGLPHRSAGLMKVGPNHTCNEIFHLPNPSSSGIHASLASVKAEVGDEPARFAVSNLNDSNGLTANVLPGACGETTTSFDNDTTDFGLNQ